MKIKGEIINSKTEDPTTGTFVQDSFLRVSILTTAGVNDIKIPLNEFQEKYTLGKNYSKQQLPEAGIGSPSDVGAVVVKKSAPKKVDFTDTLLFILEKISHDKNIKLTDDDELIIQSGTENILELPWENFVDQKTAIYREVLNSGEKMVESEARDFLIIKSLSYFTDTETKPSLNETAQEEAYKVMLEYLVKDNKPNSRLDSLHLIKNATIENIRKIEWDKFNLVHMIMHGEEDGRLCFEHPNNYEKIDHMEAADFIDLVKESRFSLVFLSFCFSAGGGGAENSLSFKLIQSKVAQNIIAYNGLVGSTTAQKFAEHFYSNLMNGRTVKDAYKVTKADHKGLTNEYTPFFYTQAA